MAYNYTNPFNNLYNPNFAPGGPLVPQMPAYNQQNDLIFVLDENAARSYPVANGQKITLWDKNYPKFYIKSVDMAGIPSFRKFSFTEDVDQPNIETSKPVETITDEYVTSSDLDKFYEKIIEKINEKQSYYDKLLDKLNERQPYHKKPQQNKES